MPDLFDKLSITLLGKEGGYVNNPNDSGGETNWGVTVAVARVNGYAGSMKAMTREQALAIYRKMYWEGPGFPLVALISERIAGELFDTGVNMGDRVAVTFLQQSLNVLNRQQKDYKDITVDGKLGKGTLDALKLFMEKRGLNGVTVLMKALNILQGARYIQIAQGGKNEEFVYGWLRERVALDV